MAPETTTSARSARSLSIPRSTAMKNSRSSAIATDRNTGAKAHLENKLPAGMPVDPERGAGFGASGKFGTPGAVAPTDIIPASRLSPAGQAYLAPLPLPNVTANLCSGDNWVDQVVIP